MAVDNIDLSGEIKAWKDAAYGKDVRAANVAAFEKIQGTVNDTVQNVNQASKDASSASQNAQKAVMISSPRSKLPQAKRVRRPEVQQQRIPRRKRRQVAQRQRIIQRHKRQHRQRKQKRLLRVWAILTERLRKSRPPIHTVW